MFFFKAKILYYYVYIYTYIYIYHRQQVPGSSADLQQMPVGMTRLQFVAEVLLFTDLFKTCLCHKHFFIGLVSITAGCGNMECGSAVATGFIGAFVYMGPLVKVSECFGVCCDGFNLVINLEKKMDGFCTGGPLNLEKTPMIVMGLVSTRD